MALKAGMKKGGAAKGELVLAIFELANCFRHGWGVSVDKFAAKQVYILTSSSRFELKNSITNSTPVLRDCGKSGGYWYVTSSSVPK